MKSGVVIGLNTLENAPITASVCLLKLYSRDGTTVRDYVRQELNATASLAKGCTLFV